MNRFGTAYSILWIALIGLEVLGATTNYVPLDTMSEYYWSFQDKYPNIATMAMSAGLVVLWLHLCILPHKIK